MSLSNVLGGIFSIGQQLFPGDNGLTRPQPTRVAGQFSRQVTASGVGTTGILTPGAPAIIALILSGSGDATVRTAARTARVGKKQLLESLVAMDEMSAGRAFSPSDKMFVSNEIEKIFKPRRRSAIPKTLKRSVMQIKWLQKNLRSLFPRK